jgi:hypothetical protein
MDVIGLLRSKNRCLQRFLEASEAFLAVTETGDFAGLSTFHERRESILKAIGLYDRKITEAVRTLDEIRVKDPVLVETVRGALDAKTALIHKILSIDDKIVANIEQEKARVSRELSTTARTRETVGKFRSTRAHEAGEELDKKL